LSFKIEIMVGFFSKAETASITRPDGKVHTCISCGAFKTAHTPKMKPYGNFKKGIMNIGECPEAIDDYRGKPFQGAHGRLLQQAYSDMGIDLFEDCINLNSVNCYPTDKDGKPREPSPVEVDTCRKSILAHIRKYKPKVIVLLGDNPVDSVIGSRWKSDLGTIGRWRGWAIPDQEYKAWLIPAFSPGFVSQRPKNPEVYNIWKKDLLQVKEKLNEKFPVVKTPVIEVIDDFSCLDKIIDGVVAFDYETTGLKPHGEGHKIVCVSIADTPDHVYVSMMPESKSGRKSFLKLLTNNRIGKMAHNMKFELAWSYEILKTEVDYWRWDSMLAAHILDNRENSTSLKFQAYVQFGVDDYAEEISPFLKASDDKNANSLNRILELVARPGGQEQLLTYCGLDSIYEYRLAMLQQSIIHPYPF
jgi:uracil-DNA glycosylase family 4